MPITISPAPHHARTLLFVFEGRWTWEEFHAAYDQLIEQSRAFERQPWHIISVLFNLTLPPGDAINHGQKEFRRAVEHGARSLICATDSPLFTMLGRLGVSFYGEFRGIFHVVNGLEAGYAIVEKAEAPAAEPTPSS
jgi:hypothetical protein